MHLAILDNRRRHSWTNVWQRLQLLGVGSVDCQRSCCHSRDRYRWRLDSADNDMKVFETFRVEVIDDGHSGADQQRCAQEQDRNPLLPVEVN